MLKLKEVSVTWLERFANKTKYHACSAELSSINKHWDKDLSPAPIAEFMIELL